MVGINRDYIDIVMAAIQKFILGIDTESMGTYKLLYIGQDGISRAFPAIAGR